MVKNMNESSIYTHGIKDELSSAQFLAMLMLKSPDFSYAMLLRYFLLDLYGRISTEDLDPKTFAETLKLYGECLEILNKIKTEETAGALAELDKMYTSTISASVALRKALEREKT